MASAVRQLPARARTTPRLCAARTTALVRPGHHAVAPAARVRAVTRGARGYHVRAGEEDLSEEAKRGLNDEKKLNLGKTISILKDRLPTILQQPLPASILAPNISLHLFPTTHPHLPVANGRAAYKAALWTSPLAWNRVPIIGHVGIEVHTVRMQPGPVPFAPARAGALDDVMVVRWVTEKESVPSDFLRDMARRLARNGETEEREERPFAGVFTFQFDGEGRVLDHTIESAELSRWGKGVGSSVVRFTDRLLGGIRQRGGHDPLPMPACWRKGGRKG